MSETAAQVPTSPEQPLASVVIVTRNRPAETRRAVESALAQSVPVEVLVYDDASDSAVADELKHFGPAIVRVTCLDEHVGYIGLRNRGMREAASEVVFSLDDDAYFSDADCASRTLHMFNAHPEAFAVAIPFVERPRPGLAAGSANRVAGEPVRNYIGCSHAVRRDEVLAAGGYRELLVHQTEERDLCLRMLARGREVVAGEGGPIVHDYNLNRDIGRLNYYGVRNTLLVTFLNVPLGLALVRMVIDSLQLLRYRFRWRSLPDRIRALSGGWIVCLRYAGERRAVPAAVYREFRSRPVHGPVLVETLPPACGGRRETPVG